MKALSLTLVILLSACQATVAPEAPAPSLNILPQEILAEVEPAAIKPPKAHFMIENIMNLARDTLQNILGKASLVRTEKDARVWLYQNRECVMHLYFYPNENGDFRLTYVATAAADLSAPNPTVSPNACLDSHIIPEKNIPQKNIPQKNIPKIKADPGSSSPGTGTDPQPDMSGS